MKLAHGAAIASIVLALAACQGNFGSGGTGMPGSVNPPVNAPEGPLGGATAPASPQVSGTPTSPPGDTASYAFSQASTGFKCPESQGFSCFIRLNVSDSTPSPSAAPSSSSSPSSSPSPSPSPSPSASTSDAPSPTPTPTGANIKLALSALPKKDVPSMVDRDPKAVATIALVALRVTADADITLEGKASADFTLPKEQIGGRGFAVQLFHETHTKKKHSYDFFGSYDTSKIDGTTLHFGLTVPKLVAKKGETWLFVLYGGELPSKTPDPSPSPSVSPSASASPRS